MELYKKTVNYIDKKTGESKQFLKAVCEVEINNQIYVVDLEVKQGGIIRDLLLKNLPEYARKGGK
jgi:hypothetical protein